MTAPDTLTPDDRAHWEKLLETLRTSSPSGTLGIAFSGGLDSRFLAFAAKRAGLAVKPFTLTGAHLAPEDTAGAVTGAQALGLVTEVIPVAVPFEALAKAGRDRCYVCKKALFTLLLEKADGMPLADGTNASDLTVVRPGRKALQELGILSPLAAAGLAKSDIRRIGAALGFPDPQQAARPCLLTRFPYGVVPAEDRLTLAATVERAVADDPLGRTLDYRLRFPDGITPQLHVLARPDLTSEILDGLCGRLKALDPVRLRQLTVLPMATLSGWFDRG